MSTETASTNPNPAVVVRRVYIENYKSIARCNVELGPLQFLVGRNGSGKSNFLDALRFASDSLDTSVEQALRDRGGIDSVRRKAPGHPRNLAIRLDLLLDRGARAAHYAFQLSSRENGGFVVRRESLEVDGSVGFRVEEGRVVHAQPEIASQFEPDRLALSTLSGMSVFRPVYDVLRRMHFYNLNPEKMRDLQDPDPGRSLARDGRNLAAVIRELSKSGAALEQVREHLQAVVPGIVSVKSKPLGPKETLEFQQMVAGDQNPWRFLANNMSDGTLRALGILAATLGVDALREAVTVVGIEEPETALHPAAAEVVTEVLMMASKSVQILATTHSPELLARKDLSPDQILGLIQRDGDTLIAPVGAAARSVLLEHLYQPGELLSMGQLEPGEAEIEVSTRQLDLFSESP